MTAAAAVILGLFLAFLTGRRFLIILGSWLPGTRRGGEHPLPTVTILVAARDEECGIGKLFRALDDQDYPRHLVHICLINDGSTDRTLAAMMDWSRTHPNCSVIDLPSSIGKAGALQQGLESAPRSTVTVTFDADMAPARQSLRALVAPFDDPRVGASGGYYDIENALSSFITRYAALEIWVHFLVNCAGKDRWGLGPLPSGGIAAYRTEVLVALGGFHAAQSDDSATAMRILRAGYATRWIRDASTRTRVVTSLSGLLRQRERWSASLASAAPASTGVETLLTALGYADRIALAAGVFFSALGLLSPLLPAAYAASIVAAVVTGLARAGNLRRLPEFFAVVLVMAPVELWMSASGALSRNVPRWNPIRSDSRREANDSHNV